MSDRSKGFSQQLRDAIEASGITRYQICKGTGIDQGNLSRFMNGGGMSVESIDQLFAFLNLTIVPKRAGHSRRRGARKDR